jgi:hypothetical protein
MLAWSSLQAYLCLPRKLVLKATCHHRSGSFWRVRQSTSTWPSKLCRTLTGEIESFSALSTIYPSSLWLFSACVSCFYPGSIQLTTRNPQTITLLIVRRMLILHSHSASSNLDASSILPSVKSYDPFTSNGNHPDLFPMRSSHQTIGEKELPMEIDLSEFTLDTDLDWFTRSLEPNQ